MQVAKKSQAGFSLVELLVAVMILAIGLLGLAQLQVSAIKTNATSASSTTATALAQRVIEEIAAMSLDDPLFDTVGSGTWPGSPFTIVDAGAGGGSYDVTYTVSTVLADPDDSGTAVSNIFQVDIEVKSSVAMMNILGAKQRIVTATTLKRAI